MKIVKIISGGQTGADRAALDAAIECGVPHGGWCPKGRLAEDGPISPAYNLQETESEEYPVRTRMNAEAADLTLIFSHGPLSGGSLLTLEFAKAAKKPCVHIDLNDFQCLETNRPVGAADFQALEKTGRKVPSAFALGLRRDRRFGEMVVNVAGPRASGDPAIYAAVYSAMTRILRGS